MKTLLTILLVPFLLLSASSLNRDAKDFHPSSDLFLDFCLNSESLDAVENLSPPGNRINRHSNSPPGSVFALLREGQSISPPRSVFALLREGKSISPLSPEMGASNESGSTHSGGDEDYKIKESSLAANRLASSVQNQAESCPQNAFNYQKQVRRGQDQCQHPQQRAQHQRPMECLQPPIRLAPIIQYPMQVFSVPIVIVPSVHYFFVPVPSPTPRPYLPSPSIHQQPLNNYSAFNLHCFDSEGKPGDFITQLGSLNSLSQAIESLNMFNQNISYLLISEKYSSHLLVRNQIVNSIYFTIGLNPRILATIIPAIQQLIWSYKPFLRGILTIVLDFKSKSNGPTMSFVFKEKCLQLANEMRISLSELCQPSVLGNWNA